VVGDLITLRLETSRGPFTLVRRTQVQRPVSFRFWAFCASLSHTNSRLYCAVRSGTRSLSSLCTVFHNF